MIRKFKTLRQHHITLPNLRNPSFLSVQRLIHSFPLSFPVTDIHYRLIALKKRHPIEGKADSLDAVLNFGTESGLELLAKLDFIN